MSEALSGPLSVPPAMDHYIGSINPYAFVQVSSKPVRRQSHFIDYIENSRQLRKLAGG